MVRRDVVFSACLVGAATALLAGQSPPVPVRAPGTRIATAFTCAATLGTGVKSRRAFCDVIIAGTPKESVMITIPPHSGAATLWFDLHNRFTAPVASAEPAQAFEKHSAVARVIRSTGQEIGRAASIREFRTSADLFDHIGGGGGPGGVKAIAPGPAEVARLTIPAGVTSVGIVGVALRVRTGPTTEELFDTPGRPIAIVSNVRVEYQPLP